MNSLDIMPYSFTVTNLTESVDIREKDEQNLKNRLVAYLRYEFQIIGYELHDAGFELKTIG